ncbi:MAG: non-canonical purine NTP pyrophosphatase [Patescibacteria group bacterium]
MTRTILLGTTNPHKIQKLSRIVSGYFEPVRLEDTSISAELNEEGQSFESIATDKAVTFSKRYDGYAIATDGGIDIPALGSRWNKLFTRRFINRENATDFERLDAILELMKDKRGDERKMIWREAAAIAHKGKRIFSLEVDGSKGIMQESYDRRKYRPGIWLCSLWYYPQFGKNFFDLSPSELAKGEVSWDRLEKAIRTFFETGRRSDG